MCGWVQVMIAGCVALAAANAGLASSGGLPPGATGPGVSPRASAGGGPTLGAPSEPLPPSRLLRADALRGIVSDRDVSAHAELNDVPESKLLKRYSYYAAVLIHASSEATRRTLTDYKLYSKMIPYVDRTDYDPASRLLDLEGGIWKFRLHSIVAFEEHGDRWIHYRIVGGHFNGLSGDLLLEPMGERGTLVYLRGEQLGAHWPPKFVIERGAEIVFEYTAKRMRSYIESLKDQEGDSHGRQGLPKPRSHL